MCISNLWIMQSHYFGIQVKKKINTKLEGKKQQIATCQSWIKALFNVQHTGTYLEAGLGGKPNVQQKSGVLMPDIGTDIPSPWRRGLDRKAADYIQEQCSRVKHGGIKRNDTCWDWHGSEPLGTCEKGSAPLISTQPSVWPMTQVLCSQSWSQPEVGRQTFTELPISFWPGFY